MIADADFQMNKVNPNSVKCHKEENAGKGCLQAMNCFYICLTNLSFRLMIQEQHFQATGAGQHDFRGCVGPLPQVFLLQC